MAMATGYESYVTLMYSQPAVALQNAQLHLQALMELQGARVGSDGTTYDPSTIEAAINSVRRDIQWLAGRALKVGQPRFTPTRRVDPGGVYLPTYGQ